jgi:hypothetical protein
MSSRFPVLATVSAAYRDVFADFPAFLRSVWLILALLIVVVEIPTLLVFEHIRSDILPELQEVKQKLQASVAQGATALDPADQEKAEQLTSRLLLPTIGILGINLLWMVLLFRFTYAWYRQLLTGEEKGKLIGFRLAKPEWQLIWTGTKVALVLFPLFFMGFGVLITVNPPPGAEATGSVADVWPYLAVMIAGLLYLQSRMTVAYPATVIGDTDAPVRQSWNLTRRQSLRLIAGNLLAALPALLAGIALFFGLAGILQFVVPMPELEMGQEPGRVGVVLAQVVVKIAISAWSLLFFALLSAFHAHAYAYLVRSSSSVSSH